MSNPSKSKKELQVMGGVFLILVIILLSGVCKDEPKKEYQSPINNEVKSTEQIQREAQDKKEKEIQRKVEEVKDNYEKNKTTYDPDQQKIYDELYKKNLETEKNKNIK